MSSKFSLIECFLKFLLAQSSFIVSVIKCTNIILSEKCFSSVTFHKYRQCQRLCSNAQCSNNNNLVYALFHLFFDDNNIFAVCGGNREY